MRRRWRAGSASASGRELGIPVYLYEFAAAAPHRRNLADIRAGEYEGLAGEAQGPGWQPDFGPAGFVPRSGATVIGARKFLVAYNINLNTLDKRLANRVALRRAREGPHARDEAGKPVLDAAGKPVWDPGILRSVKAVGWTIPEFGCAQISMNLTDLDVTPLHVAFDTCDERARERGLRVTGSELVGLVPQQVAARRRPPLPAAHGPLHRRPRGGAAPRRDPHPGLSRGEAVRPGGAGHRVPPRAAGAARRR